ncbi:MAG: thiolase family protein, partial [Acidimicrobiia bacterium]|nr:thiolase family protein [Acidimicrobiia bacterium]
MGVPAAMSVHVAGVGLHPFGRFDASLTEMGVAAVSAALADAAPRGGGRGAFDVAFCATAYGGVAAGHKVLGALGLAAAPIVNVEAGCASGAAALSLAAAAVEAGTAGTALAFGIEKMPRGMVRSSFFEPWREAAGLAATPAYFALRAQRLMREASLSKDHLAAVVVKNRRHGAANPDAMFSAEVTADEVLASRVVCEPLHLWMLCSPNEGAAAVVVRPGDGPRGSVRVAATSLRSHLPGSVLGEATPLSGIDDDDIPPPTTLAAADAFTAAGLGPADLDVVECQDTDAARELLAYVELGLCAHEDLAGWVTSGHTRAGGALPVNVSGGILARREPLAASALGQVVELVL